MMNQRFLIIHHDAHEDNSPKMELASEARASYLFDMSDYLDGTFTVMYLHDDNKLYEVTLEEKTKVDRTENSIVYAISEMWIQDRHTFGMAVVGHCQHTDH